MEPSFLPFRSLQRNTAYSVAGPLKLATKYHVDGMQNNIIAHLEMDWPTSLADWDSIAYVTDGFCRWFWPKTYWKPEPSLHPKFLPRSSIVYTSSTWMQLAWHPCNYILFTLLRIRDAQGEFVWHGTKGSSDVHAGQGAHDKLHLWGRGSGASYSLVENWGNEIGSNAPELCILLQ